MLKIKGNKWLIALMLGTMFAPAGMPTAAAASDDMQNTSSVTNPSFQDLGGVTANRQQSILRAVRAGLLQGDNLGDFRPSDMLTRQEMAVILTRLLRLPLDQSASSFSDVSPSEWASSSIEAVSNAGLMVGDGSGAFHPTAPITREELAVLFTRTAQLPLAPRNIDTSAMIDWQDVSEWAKPSVNAALNDSAMDIIGSKFQPKAYIQRQEIADMLLTTFFPTDHMAYLQRVEDGKVWINGISYKVADSVKGLLNTGNRAILEGAKIQITSENQTVQSVTKLELNASGRPASEQSAEFSGNLVLDGHGAAIEGDLTLAGNYLSVNNLNVKHDFTITPELANDFSAKHLQVYGNTVIQGGDENTVLFEDSQLQSVDVSKQDVHVVVQGSSSVEQMTVSSNASITAADTASLQQVTVAAGAQQVELEGNVQSVVITSNESITLSGSANIGSVVVDGQAAVNLNGTGTISALEVNNASSNVSVSSAAQVSNVSLADGVSSSSVSGASSSSSSSSTSNSSTNSSSGSSSSTTTTNTAPTLVAKYTDQTITVGDADLPLDVLGHFTDAQQSVLKYSVTSTNSNICKAALVGDTIVLTAVAKGKATISVVADDQAGKKTGTTFKVTVNAPPVSAGITDQTSLLGTGDVALSLSSLFSDPDNDALTYSVTVEDASIATYNLSGDQLTLTPAKAGTTNVTVKATDGRGGESSQTFKLIVGAQSNQDPIVSHTVENQSLTMGEPDYTLDLAPLFSDPDNDTLTYSITVEDASVASYSLSGDQLTLTPVQVGTTNVTVKAADGRGGESSQTFQLTIGARPNQNPIVRQMPDDQTITVGDSVYRVDLAPLFSDPDNDPLTFEAESSDPTLATVTVNGTQAEIQALASGTATIQVKADDGQGGEETASFKVKVNEAPLIGTLPAQMLRVNDAPTVFDLSSYLSDPDNNELTVKATSADTGIVTVSAYGQDLTLTPVATGSTSVTVNVYDGYGGTLTTNFAVVVSGTTVPLVSNQAPEVCASIYEQVLTSGVTNPRTYDLSQLFYDADGDNLTFTAVAEMPDIVNASMNGNEITLTPGTAAGSTKVTITADDGMGNTASYDFTVRNAPLVTANSHVEIRTKQGVKDSITYDLSSLFPGEASFQIYTGTADSTFTGPTTLNGTIWTWNGDMMQSFWIVGGNGLAVVLHVTSVPQGSEELYFSQYLSLDKTRHGLELYFNPVGDTSQSIKDGYSLEVHQYNSSTNTPKVWSQPISEFWKGMPFIFIDSTFYDFFDIINCWYYNDEIPLMETNANVTTGFVLKKNGVIIDVLGDPNGKTQFMPNNGTIIRKSGILSGSSSFDQYGEWNTFSAGTLQYFGNHTP